MRRGLSTILVLLLLAGIAVQAASAGTQERNATDAALAAERAAVDAELAQRDATIVDLKSTVTQLKAENDALAAENAALVARIAELEGSACDLTIDGAEDQNIQGALNALPNGGTLCASGTFQVSTPISPKSGHTIQGPATFIGQNMTTNEDLFRVRPAVDVTLVDLEISGAGRHGVACWQGTTVLGGRLYRNGKDGIGCNLDGPGPVLVDGAEIDHNGTDPYWLGKGAAGIKWFHATGVEVRNSFVHSNTGNGVWCDAQCGDFTVVDNVITQNTRKGVFYEKGGESDGSFGGATFVGQMVVTGNRIQDNNTEGKPSAHAGVSIYTSKNALVSGNTFGGNGRAVIAREDTARLNDDKHGWHLENITISDNSLNGDELVGCDAPGVTCLGNV